MKEYSILMIMVDSRDIKNILNPNRADYNELSCIINSFYCKKYKYNFKYIKIKEIKSNIFNKKNGISSYCYKTSQTRSASWCKLLAIHKELKSDYDYIIYIDTDCIILNFENSFNKYLNLLNDSGKDILMFNDQPTNLNLPTAGFMILKNTTNSSLIIKKWWESFSKYGHRHSYEQMSLHEFYQKQDEEIVSKIIICNESQFELKGISQTLLHINTENDLLRKPIFKYVLNKKKVLDDKFFVEYLNNKTFFHILDTKDTSLNISNTKHNFKDSAKIFFMSYFYITIFLNSYDKLKFLAKYLVFLIYPLNNKTNFSINTLNKLFNLFLKWKKFIAISREKKQNLDKYIEVYKKNIF